MKKNVLRSILSIAGISALCLNSYSCVQLKSENPTLSNVGKSEIQETTSRESEIDKEKVETTKPINNTLSSYTITENLSYMNKDFSFSEITYHYKKHSKKQNTQNGKIISFPKTDENETPKSIEIKNVVLKDKESDRILKIRTILAWEFEERNGILYPKNIELKKTHTELKLIKMNIYSMYEKISGLHEINQKIYPKNHEVVDTIISIYLPKNKPHEMRVKKMSYSDLSVIKSKLVPKNIEIIDFDLSLYKLLNLTQNNLEKKYIPLVNYFLKSAKISIKGNYNNENMNLKYILAMNKNGNISGSIDIPNFLDYNEKFLNTSKLFLDSTNKKDEKISTQNLNESIAFFNEIMALISIKEMNFNFKNMPIPLPKNSQDDTFATILTNIFKNRKESIPVNLKINLNLNAKTKNTNNLKFLSIKSSVDNVYNIDCLTNFTQNSEWNSLLVQKFDCTFFGKKVFDVLLKVMAKNINTSIKNTQSSLISEMNQILDNFNVSQYKKEMAKFIVAPKSFQVTFQTNDPISIYEIVNLAKTEPLDFFSELNFSFIANPNTKNQKTSYIADK